MKTVEEVRGLIVKIKTTEDEYERQFAIADLMAEILQHHMHRVIGRLLKVRVSGMDTDDIRQTFAIGCVRALQKVDPDIGNPLQYILWKGRLAVIDHLKRALKHDIKQHCHHCGRDSELHQRDGQAVCPLCGARGDDVVERIYRHESDDGTILARTVVVDRLSVEDRVISRVYVEQFRQRLTGRKRDVFDLIYDQRLDRDHCDNYIREVANRLGVTQTNVNLRLRQIKQAWQEYVEEAQQHEECGVC